VLQDFNDSKADLAEIGSGENSVSPIENFGSLRREI
jgi:hypothetical protein